MPIKEQTEPRKSSVTKKTGKQKKISRAKSSAQKKQIISKSKGQNIQIHIDLSKKRSGSVPIGHSRRESKQRQEAGHKKDTQPIINIPPPSYGLLQPQTNYDNSMFQALNKIMEQNKRFEEALKGEQKKENVFTGRVESVSKPSLADIINKNTPSIQSVPTGHSQRESIQSDDVSTLGELEPMETEMETESLQQQYGTQLETPLDVSSISGGLVHQTIKEPSRRDLGNSPATSKELKRMNKDELILEGRLFYGISPTYKAYKKNGEEYEKSKTKDELLLEIKNAKMEQLRKK